MLRAEGKLGQPVWSRFLGGGRKRVWWVWSLQLPQYHLYHHQGDTYFTLLSCRRAWDTLEPTRPLLTILAPGLVTVTLQFSHHPAEEDFEEDGGGHGRLSRVRGRRPGRGRPLACCIVGCAGLISRWTWSPCFTARPTLYICCLLAWSPYVHNLARATARWQHWHCV